MLQKLFTYQPKIQPHLKSNVQTITPVELQQRLAQNEDLVLVDVRSPAEFAYDGHIANSRLLPLPQLRQRSNELSKDKPIVCICRSGNRSQAACEQLAALGYTDTINLVGGMISWRQANLPTQF